MSSAKKDISLLISKIEGVEQASPLDPNVSMALTARGFLNLKACRLFLAQARIFAELAREEAGD